MTDPSRLRRSRFDAGPTTDSSLLPSLDPSQRVEVSPSPPVAVADSDSSGQTARRVRRSRFDAPPAVPPQTEYLPILPLIDASQPRFGIGSSEAALNYLTAPMKAESTNIGLTTFSLGGYEIVLQRKLEYAMIRNFEYLLRKDANPLQPVEQMPRQSSWGAGKDFARAKKQATTGTIPQARLPSILIVSKVLGLQRHQVLRQHRV